MIKFFYSFLTNEFLLGIIHQKIRTRLVKVFLHVLVFGSCFIGHEWGGPDLAVGVRVGTSHYCTLVLKYLHPPENWRIGKVLWNLKYISRLQNNFLLVFLSKIIKFLHPCINDMSYFLNGHDGYCYIRFGAEAHHSAGSFGLSTPLTKLFIIYCL